MSAPSTPVGKDGPSFMDIVRTGDDGHLLERIVRDLSFGSATRLAHCCRQIQELWEGALAGKRRITIPKLAHSILDTLLDDPSWLMKTSAFVVMRIIRSMTFVRRDTAPNLLDYLKGADRYAAHVFLEAEGSEILPPSDSRPNIFEQLRAINALTTVHPNIAVERFVALFEQLPQCRVGSASHVSRSIVQGLATIASQHEALSAPLFFAYIDMALSVTNPRDGVEYIEIFFRSLLPLLDHDLEKVERFCLAISHHVADEPTSKAKTRVLGWCASIAVSLVNRHFEMLKKVHKARQRKEIYALLPNLSVPTDSDIAKKRINELIAQKVLECKEAISLIRTLEQKEEIALRDFLLPKLVENLRPEQNARIDIVAHYLDLLTFLPLNTSFPIFRDLYHMSDDAPEVQMLIAFSLLETCNHEQIEAFRLQEQPASFAPTVHIE